MGGLLADNDVEVQRDMEVFHNEWSRLTKKESTIGLTDPEKVLVNDMSITKIFIDLFVEQEDMGFIESIEKNLKRFKQ